jgi:hypothetical protein
VAGLREQLADADARTFAGRAAELRAVDAFLAPGSAHRFLFVHGPRGIGKSALVREAGRRAGALGYDVVTHVGDDRIEGRVLVLLDDVVQVADTAAALREWLLDTLSAKARVVLASSERPHPAWWAGGLDTIARDLCLGPLSDGDARAVLSARGLTAPRRQDELIAWAHGSPLALGVAASLDASTDAVAARLEPALEERVGGWLAGDAIDSVDPEVLDVAALTSSVDARMLSAALPGRTLRGTMTQLFELPVVSRHGHSASLHPALRRAIATRLRVHERSRHRDLLRRLALHLAERARLGDHEALVQLSGLIESPELVAGTGPSGSRTHIADSVRAGDLEALAAPEALAWFVARFPECATVIRHADGAMAGLVGGAPLTAVAAETGPFPAALNRALDTEGCDPARTLVGPALILETDPVAVNEVLRVGYSSALRRGGVADLRFLLSYYPDPTRLPSAFLAAAPWRPVPILDMAAWLIDWGPAGAIGFALNTVLREQGYPDRTNGDAILTDPARLAAALPGIFGDSVDDRLLRRVIELAHLSPGTTQGQIIATLHVSRATYFRLLRRARERVLEWQ